jgi:predicted nucleic acid-binding Zn ribbon protein
MALINCPECQKEISSEARSCPNCGYSLRSKRIRLELSKKTKVTVFFVMLLALVLIGVFLLYSNYLSRDERIAVTNVKDLKLMLKDPDSLKLYEDVLVVWYAATNEEIVFYTYISYGAKNGYGAIGRDIAIYRGYEYIGDFSDEQDENDVEKKATIIKAEVPYLLYKFMGVNSDTNEGVKKATYVKKEKIMKKIDW